MLDQRSRVTVVGSRKRIDVVLPATAPVGEYAPRLADLCGQEQHDVFPPTWSLAPAGAAPLAPSASLAEGRIVDGSVLYLTDVAGDPTREPAVEDISEVVAEESGKARDRQPRRGVILTGLALAWLAATAALFAPRAGETAVILCTVAIAVVLLAVAWPLRKRHTKVPAALPLAMSLTAAAATAVVGGFLVTVLAGPAYWWLGLLVGANLGVGIALASIPHTVPDTVLAAVQLHLLAGLLLTPLFLFLPVTRAQVAAAVVVLAVALLGASKWLAATITAWLSRPVDGRTPVAPAVTAMVGRADRLLTALIAGPVLALTVAVPVLAATPGWFPGLLAAVSAVALLVRTQLAGTASESVGFGAAAMVGLFALVGFSAHRWGGIGLSVVLLTAAGFVVLVVGLTLTLIRLPIRGSTHAVTLAGAAAPGRRPAAEVIGLLCHLATAPLAMGVYGVYGDLLAMGRDAVS